MEYPTLKNPPDIPDTLGMYPTVLFSKIAIEQINKNIDIIRQFMVSQNVQNECFMFNESEMKKRIEVLEKKLEEKNNDLSQ